MQIVSAMHQLERLHRYIVDSGYRIIGVLEEEYLTRSVTEVVRSIISTHLENSNQSELVKHYYNYQACQ